MPEIESDRDREHRIAMEVVVDAYNEEEQAMGWYYYLEDKLSLPFPVRCTARRSTSPLRVGDEVEVVGMPSEVDCQHEMLVTIRWENDEHAVPLSQLEVLDGDDDTQEAVKDWHYWTNRGYRF